MEKQVLDVCCGSRMFWFDKENPIAIFNDIREEEHELCDGRSLSIKPDTLMDFTDLDFQDEQFKLVVFDPPHFNKLGKNSWMAKKYGVLKSTWQDDLKKGFEECFRVLEPNGILIFKWNETQIKTSEILKLTTVKPLFGHVSGKRANTHWICFMKSNVKKIKVDSPEKSMGHNSKGAYVTHARRTEKTSALVIDAIEQLKANNKPITKVAVAKLCGVSREQLSRRYKHLFAA